MGQDKAGRILDAAEALLIAYGYRKVTVDDVARRSGVGKGTVYLYWGSKRELFAAVLAREAAGQLAARLAALLADPGEVRLHRAMRLTYLEGMRRPLSRAFLTADRDALGELLAEGTTGPRLAAEKSDRTARYLDLLREHGLLTGDPLAQYRLSAVMTGFCLLDGLPGFRVDGLALEEKAEALAVTVRRAFEPDGEPEPAALRAAAEEAALLYREWLAELTAPLPGGGQDTSARGAGQVSQAAGDTLR
ncbi:AcrR family transcriptional regulator [Thermocatellispora tengchongensis]|uniref:AcrR family transcriptional regulator n=1 Tax=Thermocatellispora tengchongensis TaxID=1073253 RepID=A0A840PCP7_9ACTN|nr:TetR/AcrR family transcriptional regulator [Thermocatellispora tengchongensis]MBB5134947.1 AcrR family transcriptional regulator [Thermocatellispora tengchongensis]